jgi:hypothetical protein
LNWCVYDIFKNKTRLNLETRSPYSSKARE